MQLTITGYSTALFSTWYFIEELGVLLDCGDGAVSALLQKSRKIEHIFITHADRDHLGGLLQMNQLNARPNFPVIHYPKHCGSFPALAQFTQQFDPHSQGSIWQAIADKDKVWIKKDVYVMAIKNNHVPCADSVQKSMGYKIVQVKHKLKLEYAHLSGKEIQHVIHTLGKEETHNCVETTLLAYSGDTPCENFEHWQDAQVLIHEATFLGGAEDAHIQTHGNRHSYLEQVISAVSKTAIQQLVLGHFSSRYNAEQIKQAVVSTCKNQAITIPVYCILPGVVERNILNTVRVY